MDIDYSDLEKIYMIRNKNNNKYCGFQMSDTNKAYPYKQYGSAINYIKKHRSNTGDYEIDVFVCVHKNLPDKLRNIYK